MFKIIHNPKHIEELFQKGCTGAKGRLRSGFDGVRHYHKMMPDLDQGKNNKTNEVFDPALVSNKMDFFREYPLSRTHFVRQLPGRTYIKNCDDEPLEREIQDSEYFKNYLSNKLNLFSKKGEIDLLPVFMVKPLCVKIPDDYPLSKNRQGIFEDDTVKESVAFTYVGPLHQLFSLEARRAIILGRFTIIGNLYLKGNANKDQSPLALKAIVAMNKKEVRISQFAYEYMTPQYKFFMALMYEKTKIAATSLGLNQEDPYSDSPVYHFIKGNLIKISDLASLPDFAKQLVNQGDFTVAPLPIGDATRLSNHFYKPLSVIIVGTHSRLCTQDIWRLLNVNTSY